MYRNRHKPHPHTFTEADTKKAKTNTCKRVCIREKVIERVRQSVSERETERKRDRETERERGREREKERERKGQENNNLLYAFA